jgi:hypothetical protein
MTARRCDVRQLCRCAARRGGRDAPRPVRQRGVHRRSRRRCRARSLRRRGAGPRPSVGPDHLGGPGCARLCTGQRLCGHADDVHGNGRRTRPGEALPRCGAGRAAGHRARVAARARGAAARGGADRGRRGGHRTDRRGPPVRSLRAQAQPDPPLAARRLRWHAQAVGNSAVRLQRDWLRARHARIRARAVPLRPRSRARCAARARALRPARAGRPEGVLAGPVQRGGPAGRARPVRRRARPPRRGHGAPEAGDGPDAGSGRQPRAAPPVRTRLPRRARAREGTAVRAGHGREAHHRPAPRCMAAQAAGAAAPTGNAGADARHRAARASPDLSRGCRARPSSTSPNPASSSPPA